ncbi:MAG: hypothetical protein ACE5HT_03465 [Gemmatimonadales bacterium]
MKQLGLAVGCALIVTTMSCDKRQDVQRITRTEFGKDGAVTVELDPVAITEPPRGWTIAAQPSVVIGGDESRNEYQLSNPVDATRLSDGQIVIADRGSASLRWYDRDGRYLRDVGRLGEGPGEFQHLRWIDRWGSDSVIAYDLSLRRVSVFGPGGELTWSASAGELPLLQEFSPLQVLGDGLLLAMKWGSQSAAATAGFRQRERQLYVLDLAAGSVAPAPLRWVGAFYYQEFLPPRAPYLDIPVPFAPVMEYGAGNGRMVAGETSSLDFQVYDAGGQPLWELSVDHAARKATSGEQSWARQALERRSSNPAIQRTVARALREIDLAVDVPLFGRRAWERVPSPKPEFRSILVDSDGNIWILGYVANDQEQRPWMVLSDDGEWLGRVVLPAALEPFEIGHDFVLGLTERTDGDTAVVLYEMVRSGKH